jgi:hydroxyacylglutathione hydrolase
MFPVLSDNYGYLLHDEASGTTAAVDTPDAAEIAVQLAAKGWRLTHILNTHHHADHAGGNLELKRSTRCTIVGPRADAARIPGIDVAVGEG